MWRAVVNGKGKKKNDIRQSEARSSKQRLKGENRYEKKAAQVSLQRMADIPQRKNTAWSCNCELTSLG
jgi:hypothetical protein